MVVIRVLLTFMLLQTSLVYSATLPPDTVDILYHRYDGGGMEIDGPSVLVRKNIGPQFSLTGHYYVDSVSAASVDVLATASAYTEERTETAIGMDFLNEKTIMSLGYTNSSENDYEADTIYMAISQDFFGDLSTLSLSYARGFDEVGQVGQSRSQFEEADRHNFKLGWSQVLSKNALLGFDLDFISDEGKLENPYRQNRYINTDTSNPEPYLYQPEDYPETRTSTAFAMRGMYYLPYRASIKGEYRFFRDTWGIAAHTLKAAYVHPIDSQWIVEGKLRYYTQDQADFYSDLFPFIDSQTHLARDKEMSQFSGITFGGGVSYEIKKGVIRGVERLQFSLLLDYLDFSYDNFRDVVKGEKLGALPGEEPLYELDAWVTRASVIIEY